MCQYLCRAAGTESGSRCKWRVAKSAIGHVFRPGSTCFEFISCLCHQLVLVLAVQIRAARVPFPSVVFGNECGQARICPRYQGRWWIFSAQVELLLTIIVKHGHLSAELSLWLV